MALELILIAMGSPQSAACRRHAAPGLSQGPCPWRRPGRRRGRGTAHSGRFHVRLRPLRARRRRAGADRKRRRGTARQPLLSLAERRRRFSGADALSAFFLAPVFLFGGLGSIYGLGYWPQRRHPDSARKLQLFWGLIVAGMGLLIVARHALTFLLGWELMAVSAFFLVASEDKRSRKQTRRSHLLHRDPRRHALPFRPVRALAPDDRILRFGERRRGRQGTRAWAPSSAVFFLALVAFGLKAGIMPLHFWLPGAHANAPSHVSAMMSGVVLKMGVYGLLRFLFLLPDPPASWGALVLAPRRGVGPPRRRLRDRPARPQAPPRLPQHREHRHHPDGPGPRDAGAFRRADRVDRPRPGGLPPPRMEPQPLQIPAVPRSGLGPPRARHESRSISSAALRRGCPGRRRSFLSAPSRSAGCLRSTGSSASSSSTSACSEQRDRGRQGNGRGRRDPRPRDDRSTGLGLLRESLRRRVPRRAAAP